MEAVNKPSAISLSTLILLSLVMGVVCGAGLNFYGADSIPMLDRYLLDPLGRAFLRLIQFVVIPIVFSSLILGLTRIQNAAQVGRYAFKLLICYVFTSAIAVGLGMGLSTLLHPGSGITGLPLSTTIDPQQKQSLIEWMVSLIPTNPIEALSSGNLLQTIFSAALVGVGIQISGTKSAPFVSLVESVYVLSEKILSIILYTAPIGVFALMTSVIATQGFEVLAKLLFYVLELLMASVVMISFYTIILWVLKADPIRLLKSLFPALSLAFGTGSSNAALPVILQNAQDDYGLRPEIASFAIPLGTALKRDGSAILQGFNALFIAQVYQVPITSELLLAIALSSLLVSFSTPGVPGSGIITMTTVLSAAGLPVEGVAIVAATDRLTDGFKTILNVVGNVSNAIILSRWEPERPAETP